MARDSMEDQVKNYILFSSYTNGLALEALLKKEKIKYTIVPTPRELSVSCGICIEYKKEDEEAIEKIIENNCISIIGLRSIHKEYKKFY
jgi:ribosomal protein L7Ae-like RNA K-turn-binding protein